LVKHSLKLSPPPVIPLLAGISGSLVVICWVVGAGIGCQDTCLVGLFRGLGHPLAILRKKGDKND